MVQPELSMHCALGSKPSPSPNASDLTQQQQRHTCVPTGAVEKDPKGGSTGKSMTGHGEGATFHPLLVALGGKGQCPFNVSLFLKTFHKTPQFSTGLGLPCSQGFSSVPCPSPGHQALRLGEES